MHRYSFSGWGWLKALALVSVLLIAGCDDDWHHHHDNEDDDYPYYLVTANMTVEVRDYDTGLVVPGAEVRFYWDYDFYYSLDMYNRYSLAYADENGLASITLQAWQRHPSQCIGIRAVAEYSNWAPDSTGTVRYWYPSGGTYSTTLYLDDPYYYGATTATLEVPSSQYETIQAAINDAQVGDRILVDDGTYNETLDFQGKNITVESRNGALATVLDGGNSQRPTVRFGSGETPYAMLKGFTVRGGNTGVKINDALPSLVDNVVESGIEGTPADRKLPEANRKRPETTDVGRTLAVLPAAPAAPIQAAEPGPRSLTWLWLLLLPVIVVGAMMARQLHRRRTCSVR